LTATLHKPDAQPRLKAQRLSVKVRCHFAAGSWARSDNRGPWFTWIGAGLIVLVVLTAWAIASISVWWVPVYLALLVTIFSTPRVRQSSSSASHSSAASDDISATDLGQDLRVDRADEAEQYRLVTRSDATLTTAESAESLDPALDLTGAATAKSRRSRVRVRKASKPAAEPVAVALPVTWIQVGPGKFVRIEGGTTAAESAQTEEVLSRDTPATETLTLETPAVAAQAEPLVVVQEPVQSLGVSPREVGSVLVSTDCALGSVTEEHGIAPSTFSLVPRLNSATEGLDCCDVPDRIDDPETDAGIPADLVDQVLLPSTVDPSCLWLQPETSRLWVSRVQRRIVRAVPRVDRTSCRRTIRTCPNAQTLVGSWFAPNAQRQNAARRAFGRMAHVERTLQPRSPPGRRG
jgi:hypothetical protein